MPVEAGPAKGAKAAAKKKKKNSTILTFFNKRSPSPPPRQRPASPPHEYVPEDNSDIAVRFRRVNRVLSRGSCGPRSRRQYTAKANPRDM